MNVIAKLIAHCSELGYWEGLRWFCARVVARLQLPGWQRVLTIKPPDLVHPVMVRMLPSSDEMVFEQLFVGHEYAPLRQLKDINFVLDLGANVGFASALFASCHPNARILAVEPDPRNYELCCQNVKPYGDRVKALLGAVWPIRSRLALSRGSFGDGRDWATQVMEAGQDEEAKVEAWDVASLLDLAREEYADLVKIDIEGSEAEVFAANTTQWLPRVRNICIELHGKECREIFFRALRGFDYELAECGENTLCLNLRRAGVMSAAKVG